jgi:hypothetical protein
MAFLRNDEELPEGLVPPGGTANMIQQMIQMCWMELPKDKRSIDAIVAEINRLVARAFANLRDDEKRRSQT